MALLRLAVLSVFFGGALILLFRLLRLPLLIVCPCGLGVRRGASVLRFLSDLLISLLVAISFCIFLFWQADGIPRLFVFLAAALGAYLTAYPLSPLLRTVEGWLVRLVRYLAATLLAPPLRLFLLLLSAILSVLRKIAHGFIKSLKRHYTNFVSARYRRREPKRTEGRRWRAVVISALLKGEE